MQKAVTYTALEQRVRDVFLGPDAIYYSLEMRDIAEDAARRTWAALLAMARCSKCGGASLALEDGELAACDVCYGTGRDDARLTLGVAALEGR